MIVNPVKTRVFEEGENLVQFIIDHVQQLREESVLVVTSKIVALAERRTEIATTNKAKEQLIKAESDLAIPTKYVWLTVKDGMVMASAGIDESNAKGKLILLPRNSFKAASGLRYQLQKHYQIQRLGVLLTDSRTMPLRAGVTGVALGYAGFRGIRDYRDTPDIFGRKYKFSRTDVADSLAAAAVLVMGEGREQLPLTIINEVPVEFSDKVNQAELRIDIQEDMYRPLFDRLSRLN